MKSAAESKRESKSRQKTQNVAPPAPKDPAPYDPASSSAPQSSSSSPSQPSPPFRRSVWKELFAALVLILVLSYSRKRIGSYFIKARYTVMALWLFGYGFKESILTHQ